MSRYTSTLAEFPLRAYTQLVTQAANLTSPWVQDLPRGENIERLLDFLEPARCTFKRCRNDSVSIKPSLERNRPGVGYQNSIEK